MVEAALVSHPGRVRPENEDYAYHGQTPQGYVGIVCDGMGGAAAGEVAARVAADAAFEYLLQRFSGAGSPQLLRQAIQAAQERLLQVAQQHPQYQNFGTTIAIALIKNNMLYHAHVGDSRIYLYSRATLTLLTEDDSLVQQMLREGLITPDQALHHPQKNILSQCLGPNQQPTPHVGQARLRSGDAILLCSDGLSNLLSQEELVAQLTQAPTLSAAAESLVAQANRQGGYDNITVLLLRPAAKTPTFALPMKLPPTKYLIAGGIGLAVVILLVVIFSRSSPSAPEAGDNDVILLTDSTETQSASEAAPPASEGVPAPPDNGYGTPSEQVPPPPPVAETPQPPTETQSASKTSTSSSKSEKSGASTHNKASTIEIIVQKGDNLTQIAKAFHTTRSAIQNANGLSSDNLRAGQKLSIPVKGVKTHTVQKGENLSKLARQYQSSIEAIRRANNLSDKDEIKAGQKLRIPILE
jgi:serine/threonine protein phosphatase PrpC/LysM repeat protein